jgi:hypothetical protein
VAKDLVKLGTCLEEKMIKEAFEHIKGALTIIYPEGLPKWDSSRAAIEDDEDLEGTAVRISLNLPFILTWLPLYRRPKKFSNRMNLHCGGQEKN